MIPQCNQRKRSVRPHLDNDQRHIVYMMRHHSPNIHQRDTTNMQNYQPRNMRQGCRMCNCWYGHCWLCLHRIEYTLRNQHKVAQYPRGTEYIKPGLVLLSRYQWNIAHMHSNQQHSEQFQSHMRHKWIDPVLVRLFQVNMTDRSFDQQYSCIYQPHMNHIVLH